VADALPKGMAHTSIPIKSSRIHHFDRLNAGVSAPVFTPCFIAIPPIHPLKKLPNWFKNDIFSRKEFC